MTRFFRILLGIGSWIFSMACALAILGGVAAFLLFSHYNQDLPDYEQLADYDPPTTTRLYAGDGRVLAEYASEKRIFVPLSAIPKRVQQAFISAEDKNFYEHQGVDFSGIARAIRDNIVHYGQGKSLVGGSTITQQVVKNFLLSSEKSIERKIKEAILATRISRVYSKDKILELYLNEIYLGLGSYGVAAAAQNYFNKSLDELSIEEIALLAAQPKAPASYDPRKSYDRAKTRRDWVIDRMHDGGYVSADDAEAAKKNPITLRGRDASEVVQAEFYAEEVRRWLAQMYGANALYSGGLVVKTTLDPELQAMADNALRKTLVEYDRRHGYRGPITNLAKAENVKERLAKLGKERAPHLFDGQKLAVVTALEPKRALLAFDDGTSGAIPLALLKWTKADVRRPADVMNTGDVVLVSPLTAAQKKSLTAAEQKNSWDLGQIPEVNGAMLALDPHTGRVLAISGGYGGSEFNRATQAKRQPGSAFKPFVYLAALENGFAPNTTIIDAPIEISQGENRPAWQPQNYEGEFIGPTTVRQGLEKSRNTITVRMSEIIGLDKIQEIGKRFGVYDKPPPHFSMVLGATETTLLRLVNAYGMLANGGKRIEPAIIERVDNRHGKTIYRRDARDCAGCKLDAVSDADKNAPPPIPNDTREQVADPRVVYQIVSMLEGVTTRGTGTRARAIGKIVAGKTGTTNDSFDAWFVGFSPDLVVGVYVGYDQPRTLGAKETGSSVALPAFVDFMQQALADKPNKPFKTPRGIQMVPVDLQTGVPVTSMEPATGPVIQEVFVTGDPIFIPGVTPAYKPMEAPPVEGEQAAEPTPFAIPETPQLLPDPPITGTGGLY